jgi:nitrite reductase (NADH) small subunit/3-phenylpropionate/trans-cinnamate dioxygenase ferredoxin subunit
MALHTVCKVDQLPDGQSGVISIQGKPIAVFRTGDQYFAIDDTCPHMGASLSGGMVEEGVVTCPWHYWRFRISDGAWADNPKIKIGCYPVHIVGDQIQIEIKENY